MDDTMSSSRRKQNNSPDKYENDDPVTLAQTTSGAFKGQFSNMQTKPCLASGERIPTNCDAAEQKCTFSVARLTEM